MSARAKNAYLRNASIIGSRCRGGRTVGARLIALAHVVSFALAALLLTLLCLVAPARADDAAAYGTLAYNAVDSCWYEVDESGAQLSAQPVFRQVDGRAYRIANGVIDRSKDDRLTVRFYANGDLVFQMGEWEHPENLSTGVRCLMAGEGAAWFRNDTATMKRLAVQVTRVRIDETLADSDLSLVTKKDLSGWFSGLSACTGIEGLEHLSGLQVQRATGMFSGCAHLAELDISKLDFRSCADFTDMFAGCGFLATLKLGSSWTQAAARAQGGGVATFPCSMAVTVAGAQTVYAAGDEIPAGYGTYTTMRTSLSSAQVVLLAPGAIAVTAERLAQVGWAGLDLCAGVAIDDVIVYSDIAELAPYQVTTLGYTGAALEPTPVVAWHGTVLDEGVHYTISYSDNLEAGTATVTVHGIGAYYGEADSTFSITDAGAYAQLYENGTLVLQAGHVPVGGAAGAGGGTPTSMRWFDAGGAVTSAATESVPWESCKSSIKRVVIDESFSAFALKSTSGWFEGCTALAAVQGMRNICGARLVDMSRMFAGCTSLASIDMSGFYSAHVEDMSDMFAGCTALARIQTDAQWQNVRSKTACAVFPAEMYDTSDSYSRYARGSAIPHGAGDYRTGGLPLQLATVTLEAPSFTCTGAPIVPGVELAVGATRLRAGTDYTVACSDNVLPGTATMTIMGKGAFVGGLTVGYDIVPAVTAVVGDKLMYRTRKANYQVEVLEVKREGGFVVPARVAIVRVWVASKNTQTLALPDTCTLNNVVVDITAVDTKVSGNFKNVTCVVIGSKVTVIGAKAFAKAKKLKKLKLKTKRLTKATNSLKGSRITRVVAQCKLSKKTRKAYKKMFEKKAGKRGVKFSG